MSILKKIFKVVKKMFAKSSRPKRKTVKKKPLSSSKKKSVSKTRKKSKKIAVPSGRDSVISRRKKTPAKSLPRNLSVVKEVKSNDVRAGEVTHYFDRIKVCVIRIDYGVVKKGDRLLIRGNKSQLSQKVVSMQIENKDVSSAQKGQMIGLKVTKAVSVGDQVFKK